MEGEKVQKPENPTKEGFTFENWKNGENVYNFDDPVKSDLTLTASWKENENTNTGDNTGSDAGDSGNTGDAGDTGNTGDSGDSGDAGNTGDSDSTGGDSGTTADPNVLKVKLSTSTAANGATKGDIKLNDDGSVSYTAIAQYSGGGYYFYINEDESAIKLEDYESINIVFDYEAGAWKEGAKEPQWCLNVLPEGAGFWTQGQGAAKTLKYLGEQKKSGTYTLDYKVADNKDVNSGEFIGICLKLNCYETGNDKNDECKMTIKSIEFKKKSAQ